MLLTVTLIAPVYQMDFVPGGGSPTPIFTIVRPLRELPLFLKSLDIAGFKSFARPARFEFPPGITALVGANGSGKSNVVDAIRWCLGEQSARDLRGQRAEDVIYAGPRRLLGSAEVALTFERQERDDEDWAELAVARRLYRSGESEYLLNAARARLREVSGALRDIGIDAARHVVVTQGMADALLACSPSERRALLEQAAGLSGYRVQREEAAQKLAATARNTETALVVLTELEPRLRLLRRQARAVTERDEARANLRAALLSWHGTRWASCCHEHARSAEAAAQFAQQRAAQRSLLERLEEEMETYLRATDAWQGETDDLRRRQREVERTLHQRHIARDRAAEAVKRLTAAEAEARERVTALQQELAGARARRDGYEAILSRLRGEHDTLNGEDERLEVEVKRRQAALDTALAAASSARVAYQQARTRADQAARKRDDLAEELARLEREQQALVARSQQQQAALAAAHLELTDGERDLRQLAAEAERVTQQRRAAEGKLRLSRHRLERSEGLARRARGRAVEVRSELGRVERLYRDLERSVDAAWSGLAVRPGWEETVAAGLADWIGATETAAASHHRATAFLAWRGTVQLPPEATWGETLVTAGLPRWNPLIAVVAVEDEVAAEGIWEEIASRPAHLIASPGITVVTRSGRRLGPFGWHARRQNDRTGEYLQLRSRRAALRRAIEIHERRVNRLSSAVEAIRGQLGDVEREAARRQGTGRELRDRRLALETTRDRAGQHIAAIEAEQRDLAMHGERLAAQVPLMQRQRDELVAQSEVFRREAEEVASHSRAAEQEVEGGRAALREMVRRRDSVSVTLQTIERRREAEQESAAGVERDERRLQQSLVGLQEAITRICSQRAEMERLAAETDAAVQVVEGELAELATRLERAMRARPIPPAGSTSLREAREALTQAVARHEHALAQLGEVIRRKEALAAEIRADLALEPEALPAEDGPAPDDSELRRLRARASSYVEADESVVSELETLTERERFLREHVADLQRAAAELEQLMKRADAEMELRFASVLAAVGEEFSRAFHLMLRGGHAELILAEDGSGGVEVRAQLPGKRLRSSAAFSGGERALVASSLLFGVLRIRPVPFCVLDEVDAALDETNVDRYLAMLRDVSRRTQMIVVTHNRATMAAADVLYGLTMDDTGVTRALSLDLRTAEQVG